VAVSRLRSAPLRLLPLSPELLIQPLRHHLPQVESLARKLAAAETEIDEAEERVTAIAAENARIASHVRDCVMS
jgi:hypothetical protein